MSNTYVRYVGNRSGVQIQFGKRRIRFNKNVAVALAPGEASSLLSNKGHIFERCDAPSRKIVSSTPKRVTGPQSVSEMDSPPDPVRLGREDQHTKPASTGESETQQTEINASKAAIEAAEQAEIDIRQVKGTGTDGRINKNDVNEAVRARAEKDAETAREAVNRTGTESASTAGS